MAIEHAAPQPDAPVDRYSAAPMRQMDPAWLQRWSGHLDPRHHPSVSGAAVVSSLLRQVPGEGASHDDDLAPNGAANGHSRMAAIESADPAHPMIDGHARTNGHAAFDMAQAPDAFAVPMTNVPGTGAATWRWLASSTTGTPLGREAAPLPDEGARRAAVESIGPRSMTASPPSSGYAPRTAELLIALSSGLDAAEQRAPGHAIRTAYLCVRMAGERGLSDSDRSALLYAGLLRDAGTTGLESDAAVANVDGGGLSAGGATSKSSGGGWNPFRRSPTQAAAAHLSPPDRAAAVARVLGLPTDVAAAVFAVGERWDGRGPKRLKRDAIAPPARMLAVAATIASAATSPQAEPGPTGRPTVDVRSIERVLRSRRGRELDPEMVDAALDLGKDGFWQELEAVDLPSKLMMLEPSTRIRYSDAEGMDTLAATFADIVDTRTPRMGRHGTRVADLADRTGEALGFEPRERRELRRAGYLHDVGKLLVPIAILEKPAELTDEERRVVEEHPRTGAAILRRSTALAGLVPLIVAHHERLDGNGMFPRARDERAALAARVIAVCDRYEAMTAERPYRPLLAPDQVWRILDEVVGEPVSRAALRALKDALA